MGTRQQKKKGAAKQKGAIKMQHVFNALGQIEDWLYQVRYVLGYFDAKTEIPVPTYKKKRVFAGPTGKFKCPPGGGNIDPLTYKIGCPPPRK